MIGVVTTFTVTGRGDCGMPRYATKENGERPVTKFLLLFLISLPAHTPVVQWTLVPTFKEVNMCLEECELKAGFVESYRWEAK